MRRFSGLRLFLVQLQLMLVRECLPVIKRELLVLLDGVVKVEQVVGGDGPF